MTIDRKITLITLALMLTSCQAMPYLPSIISGTETVAEDIVELEGKKVEPKTP